MLPPTTDHQLLTTYHHVILPSKLQDARFSNKQIPQKSCSPLAHQSVPELKKIHFGGNMEYVSIEKDIEKCIKRQNI